MTPEEQRGQALLAESFGVDQWGEEIRRPSEQTWEPEPSPEPEYQEQGYEEAQVFTEMLPRRRSAGGES